MPGMVPSIKWMKRIFLFTWNLHSYEDGISLWILRNHEIDIEYLYWIYICLKYLIESDKYEIAYGSIHESTIFKQER